MDFPRFRHGPQPPKQPERLSIYSFFLRCSRNFEGAVSALRKSPGEITEQVAVKELEEEQGRFRIWAANTGAHRKGRVSLDHKLRYSTQVHGKITDLLEELGEALKNVTARTTPEDDTESDTSDDEHDEDDEDGDDDEDFIPESEEEGIPSTTPLQYAFKDVCHVISILYEFSATVLRRPAPRDRLEKSASIDVSHFEPFDVAHVREKVTATELLIQRLAKANTRRRQLLKYHQQHHQKIARYVDIDWDSFSVDVSAQKPSVQGTGLDDVLETMSTMMVTSPGLIQQLEDFEFEERKTVNTGLHSQTTVTTFKGVPDVPDMGDVESESGASRTSFASSATYADFRLKIPLPPNVTKAMNGDPFQCPYCFTIIKVRSLSSWKKHVFGDLKPYVCTHKNCRNPDQLFASRSEWIDHELRLHRREWFCGSCKLAFARREDFYLHLDSAHLDSVSREERVTLMKSCERSAMSDQECPLCPPGSAKFSNKQFFRHVARHMQQISLFVLPRDVSEEADEAESNENDTHGSRVSTGSGGDSQMESRDRSTLTFESNPSRPSSPTETSLEGLGIQLPKSTPVPSLQPEPSSESLLSTKEQEKTSPPAHQPQSPDTGTITDPSLRLPSQEFRFLRNITLDFHNINLSIATRTPANRSSRPRLYIAEHKTYDIPGLPTAFIERWIRSLAEIQHEVLPTGFLRCAGYIVDARTKKYYVLSEFPSHLATLPKGVNLNGDVDLDSWRPYTLAEMIKRSGSTGGGELHLSKVKVEIAKNVATQLRRIHEMGLVHKNISSSSILFFSNPSKAAGADSIAPGAASYIDVHHPYLTDWGYLQLDELPISTLQKMVQKKAASQHTQHPYLSIHQHPSLVSNPNTRYDARYDIYAFGLVLIEIGLWEPLDHAVGQKIVSEYNASWFTSSVTSSNITIGSPKLGSGGGSSTASPAALTRRFSELNHNLLRTRNPPELSAAIELCLSAPKWAQQSPKLVKKEDWGALWAKIMDRLAAWERVILWQAGESGKKGFKVNLEAKGWNVVGGGGRRKSGDRGGTRGGGSWREGGRGGKAGAGAGASGGYKMERGGSGKGGSNKGVRGYRGKGPLE